MKTYLWNLKQPGLLKKKLGEQTYQAYYQALLKEAKQSLQAGAYKVTDKKLLPPSGNKKDYMSFGIYWWPNPDTPDGLPYVRKDGHRNPEADEYDEVKLGKLIHHLSVLALAYYYSRDEKFSLSAGFLLRVWFLDPDTGMNPHLNYGQSIPGICDGRGIGIIDTRNLGILADASALLEGSSGWSARDGEALRVWFAAYLDWLTTSPLGKEESKENNNHGTYYDVQAVALAMHTGRLETARGLLEKAAERRILTQMESDGKQPHETVRPLGLDYSMMNLCGLMDLAQLARHVNIDLWGYQSPEGVSIRKAVDFLVPYLAGEEAWPYGQIKPYDSYTACILMIRAAAAYEECRYAGIAEHLLGRHGGASYWRLVW